MEHPLITVEEMIEEQEKVLQELKAQGVDVCAVDGGSHCRNPDDRPRRARTGAPVIVIRHPALETRLPQ